MAEKLPTTIPRATHIEDLSRDPLNYLSRTQATHGNLFAIREASPKFCRAASCVGSVVVLGVDSQRTVLTDAKSFCLPESEAISLNLPENLKLLNRSLHSMTGTEHAVQKRFLSARLDLDAVHARIWRGIQQYDENRSQDYKVGLLSEMRALALDVSRHVLFGERCEEAEYLAMLLDTYFWLRREASSPHTISNSELLSNLLLVGRSLDESLRQYLRAAMTTPDQFDGLLADIAIQGTSFGLSEDAITGHSNIVFVSTTEPIASVLTWTLLALSQFKAIQNEIRTELMRVCRNEIPTANEISQLTQIDYVIKETVRLLPPNAFMVRMTQRSVRLSGHELPARCEVVLCPLLSHRDPQVFDSPSTFDPARWYRHRPSPFAYFPFGAGQHACVGATLAMHIVKSILVFLISNYDIYLINDQEIDWRLHIQLLPTSDPQVSIAKLNSRGGGGRLGGSVAHLLGLS